MTMRQHTCVTRVVNEQQECAVQFQHAAVLCCCKTGWIGEMYATDAGNCNAEQFMLWYD